MSKVNEKTFEINLCGEITRIFNLFGQNVFWHGLTQARENILGYDVKTRVGKRALILQWKALRRKNQNGTFAFEFSDSQMRKLLRLAKVNPNLVHYGLPLFWDYNDVLHAKHFLLPGTRFLAVSKLQGHPSLNTQGSHSGVVDPSQPWIEIHSSDPTIYPIQPFLDLQSSEQLQTVESFRSDKPPAFISEQMLSNLTPLEQINEELLNEVIQSKIPNLSMAIIF